MAAGNKVFETTFRIGAKWVGHAAVAAAKHELHGVATTAQTAGLRVKGMATAVFKGQVAYNALAKAAGYALDVVLKSISAASEAQEAHDALGLSIERMSKRYKNTMGKSAAEVTAIVEESTNALIKASEVMEQTGHDAETLQKGWAKLAATGALDPKQILEQRQAFSDILSYTAGANAKAEDSVALGEAWADAILRGNIALLKQMDLTTGEIAQFREVDKQIKKGTITQEEGIKRRQDLIIKFGKKFEGETVRVFSRPSGKVAQMWTQVSNIFEDLGQPFIDRAPEMAKSFKDIAIEAKPIAENVAKIVNEDLKGLSAWLRENKDGIISWLTTVNTILERTLGFLKDIKWLYDHVPVIFDLPKVYKTFTDPNTKREVASHYIGESPGRGYAPYRRGYLPPPTPPALPIQYGGYAPYARQYSPAANKYIQGGTGQYYSAAGAVPPPKATSAAISAAASAPGGGTVEAALRSERSAVAAELAGDPELQRLLAASILAESGDQSAETQQMYMETVMNRAAARGQSLYKILRDPGYYPQSTTSRLNRKIGPQEAARMAAMTNDVLRGSNLANFATGNESEWVGYKNRERGKWLPILATGTGPKDYERFVGEEEDRKWVERHQRLRARAGIPAPAPLPQHRAGRSSLKDVARRGRTVAPAPAAPGPSETIKRAQPAGGPSLRNMLRDMNIQRRAPLPGQNVSMNPTINVNGVAPGRESLMAKKTMLALRDPLNEGLRQLREMRAEERRTNFA